MTTDKASLVKEVSKALTKKYTLEPDFVGDVETIVLECLSPYYIYNSPANGKKHSKKSGTPRAASAYNLFVKDKMQLDELKKVPQKERMAEIGKLWKSVTPEEKEHFVTLAKEKNEAKKLADTQTVTDVATEVTTPSESAAPETAVETEDA